MSERLYRPLYWVKDEEEFKELNKNIYRFNGRRYKFNGRDHHKSDSVILEERGNYPYPHDKDGD